MHRLFAVIIKSSFSFVTATPNSFLNIPLNSSDTPYEIHLLVRLTDATNENLGKSDTSYMDRYVRVLYAYLPFSVSYRGTNYVVVAYSININRSLPLKRTGTFSARDKTVFYVIYIRRFFHPTDLLSFYSHFQARDRRRFFHSIVGSRSWELT